MENRIDRKNDESLYQPKVHSDRIKELYNLKQATGMPMTVLLDQAIRELAKNYGSEFHPERDKETVFESVEKETWKEVREYRELLDRLDYLKCLAEIEIIKNDNRG
jgi:uncharacterized protein YpbB